MRINAYLNFSGQCESAFKHYEQCLGGKIVAMMDSSSAPGCDQMPADREKWIMHARLMVGDQVLMGSDAPPEYYNGTKGMSVCIGIDDVAKAKGIFDALGEGGTVTMPFEPTFFAEGFGMLVDRYGIPWMIVTEKTP